MYLYILFYQDHLYDSKPVNFIVRISIVLMRSVGAMVRGYVPPFSSDTYAAHQRMCACIGFYFLHFFLKIKHIFYYVYKIKFIIFYV